MKHRLLSLFFLLVGLALLVWSFSRVLKEPAPAKYQPLQAPASSTPTLLAGTTTLSVEIADTDLLREQGLSGRDPLPPQTGMLFVFDIPGKYGFWMKEMKFTLDIVWIDQYWTVVGIERGARPESYPEIFDPPQAIKYVLEIPAGEAAALGIDTGSKLFLNR